MALTASGGGWRTRMDAQMPKEPDANAVSFVPAQADRIAVDRADRRLTIVDRCLPQLGGREHRADDLKTDAWDAHRTPRGRWPANKDQDDRALAGSNPGCGAAKTRNLRDYGKTRSTHGSADQYADQNHGEAREVDSRALRVVEDHDDTSNRATLGPNPALFALQPGFAEMHRIRVHDSEINRCAGPIRDGDVRTWGVAAFARGKRSRARDRRVVKRQPVIVPL